MYTKEGLAERFKYPFSDEATGVLNSAGDEARSFNHNYIGTEHLLLGLIRDKEPTLAGLGVDVPKVRSTVEYMIGRGDRMIVGELGFTPRVTSVVGRGINEARRLRHPELSRLHLLSGLILEGEGIAAGVLKSLGVLDMLRERVAIYQSGVKTADNTIEALNDLRKIRLFLLDPNQPDVTKVQVGMILRGTVALISPDSNRVS